MIETFARGGFDVFPASESVLLEAMPIGGAGCISATVNMNPAGIHRSYEELEQCARAKRCRRRRSGAQDLPGATMIPR